MTECSYSSVKVEGISKHVFDVVCSNRGKIPVECTFGDNDNALALAEGSVLVENVA